MPQTALILKEDLIQVSLKQQIADFVRDYSIEMLPKDRSLIPKFPDFLAPNTSIYIAKPPNASLEDVIDVAADLRKAGFNPVPHIPARELSSKEVFEKVLERLRKADVDQILFIAGDRQDPAGPFTGTLELFESGFFEQFDLKKISVAGHPDGSPYAGPEILAKALKIKNDFNHKANVDLCIIAQVSYDPAGIIKWSQEIAAAGNQLPIHIGMPGPTKLKTLINYAVKIGIGPSLRSLKKKASAITDLLTISTPDEVIVALAKYRSEVADCPFVKSHFYSFAGIEKTALWANAVINGDFNLHSDGKGFEVAT